MNVNSQKMGKRELVERIEKNCRDALLKNIGEQKQCWKRIKTLKSEEKQITLVLNQSSEVRAAEEDGEQSSTKEESLG
jgi:hypothetical protein